MSGFDSKKVLVRPADLCNLHDQRAIIALLDQYAKHLGGRNAALPPDVLERLIPGLQSHPTAAVFLAILEDKAIGIATCFTGFSTFKAAPLLNLHDLAVDPGFHNLGVGGLIIDQVLRFAREQGCCAVTLEVRSDNPARRLYQRKGFKDLRSPTHDSTMLFGKLELD